MAEDVKRNPSRNEEILELGRLHVRSERDGDIHCIALRGELDLANAAEVDSELKRAEATDVQSIILDLSGLTFLDSTGIRLVLEAHARSQQDSDRLMLLRAPKTVQRVFGIAGVEGLLPFAD